MRTAISTRRRLLVSLCLGLTVFGLQLRARADVTIEDSGYVFEKDAPTDTAKLSWTRVVALFNQYLSNAKQLNVFTGTCRSGGLANAANGLKTVPYVVSTATTVDQNTTDGWSTADKNPPGRLPKHDTSDNVVNKSFYYSYTAYATKQLRTGVSTVQQIQDSAKNNMAVDTAVGGTPQLVTGNGGNAATNINAGASSLAMVFAGNMARLHTDLPDQPYLAFKPLVTTTSYYLYDQNPSTTNKVTIAGDGTLKSFNAGLTNLQTAIDANKSNVTTNILLEGHGYATEKNVTPAPGAIPGTPKQGEEIAPPPTGGGIQLNIGMDPGFWSDLHEGVTQSTPGLFRAEQPDFFLAISEGSISQPVGISIDGISLGDFSINVPSTGGAMLDVPLSDSFLSQLFTDEPTMPSQIPITFDLAQGDSFRLALADDILDDPTYTQPEYGTGIGLDVEGVEGMEPVPEPVGLAMVVPVCLLLRRTRRAAP
ncbi:MAG: hypothetical protein ABSB74_10515 [Tepidisphaeraceae bacterium]